MGSSSDSNQKNFLDDYKDQWKLFWAGLIQEENQIVQEDSPWKGKLETLTLEQVKALTKELSEDRKTLYQKIETINQEIDMNLAKMELQKTIKEEKEQGQILQKLSELSDKGHQMSTQLEKINYRIKLTRSWENKLKKIDRGYKKK